ncbi:MAG: hypothetical protein BZY75_05840 [SAR202 cluster bacterium Io17-Chloro-G7]|nr:MAG: hypothetical protein BZY75_05840 [SAR202 cluster bacterium Io17-Chloro-G7]
MVKVSITLPNAAQITLESEESEVIQQGVLMALRDLARDLMQSVPESTTQSGQLGDSQFSGRAISGEEDRTSPQPITNVVQEAEVGIADTTGTPPAQPPNLPLPSAPFIAEPMTVASTFEPQVTTTSGLTTSPAAPTPGSPEYTRNANPKPAGTINESAAKEPQIAGIGGSQIPTPAEKTTAVEPETATRETEVEAENQFARFCAAAAPLGDMRKVVVAAEGAKRFLGMPSVDITDLARLFKIAGWHSPHNFTQTLRNAARDKYRWLERVPGRSGRYSATELGRSVTMTG